MTDHPFRFHASHWGAFTARADADGTLEIRIASSAIMAQRPRASPAAAVPAAKSV